MAGSSPCASCKLLRRRCAKDCVFAPYFPADDPHKFAIVHKVFGASNVSKMLQELLVHQREDAVSSLVYEANARVRDPVYGCVGAISYLQNQVSQLHMQLAVARAEILCIRMQQETMVHTEPPPVLEFPGDHDGDDCKSFLLHSTSSLSHLHHHHHHHHPFLGFNSSANHLLIQDCIKKERQSIFGHDHDIVS